MLAILIVGVAFAIGALVLLRAPSDGRSTAMRPARSRRPGAIAVIGRYTIVERIGQGGMAEIYAAVTTGEGSFRRPVVIKRLRPELTADPNAVAQFCDEANLLAALHHPNIVAVHDFGALAEPVLPGRGVRRGARPRPHRRASASRATRRPLPVEVIAYVGVRDPEGARLRARHARTTRVGRWGSSTATSRPRTSMVSARGEVKLLDFGVVKATEGRLTKTEIGVVKGNVTYMAPEQARGLEVDARADLYSLALVLYFCCAGRPLYAADTTYGLLMKAGAGPGIEERTAIQQLPRPARRGGRARHRPAHRGRYANAREMAVDLEAAAGGRGR